MTEILSPIARVKIGDDVFVTGDRLLRFVSVALGEDARASKCRFEVYDPGLLLADKYFKISFEQGGIQVPDDLLGAPNQGTINSGAGGTSPTLTGGSVNADQAIKLILAECQKQGITDPDQIAYILATAYHESDRFQTTTEYASGSAYEGRSDLGNTQSGDGKRYKGRGFVQLTGRTNYEKYSKKTGIDLVANPEKAADPGLAAYILVDGMKTGGYTGKKLSDYVGGGKADFYNARRIVNGTDRADLIAGYAQDFKKKLPKYLSGAGQAQQAAAQQPTIKDKADSKPQEVASKGTEIIIELGYDLNNLIAYHFIHIGTTTQGRQLDSTAFEGQTVRWLMTRRTKNTSHGNVSFKELATKVSSSYGLDLEMEGNGPTYQHLDQTGLTDYELLLREARAIGYSVKDQGKKLVLKPARPEFTGFVITPEILINLQFGDRASKDRSPNPAATTSTPDKNAADSKLKIDRLTGILQQLRAEDSTGTGKAQVAQQKSQPDFKTQLSNTAAILNTQTQQASQGQQQATSTQQQAKITSKQAAVTGAPIKPVTGTPKPDSAQQSPGGVLPDSITGLPKQEIGAIDLVDGRAEAQTIQDESRRVKGYESSAELLTTSEVLMLAPGSIIGIAKTCVPETFAREWRLASVTHTLQNGKMTSQLEFYSPQAAKASTTAAATTGGSGTVSATTSVTSGPQSSSGWASPMAVAGNSSCGAICEFGYARGRLHAGLDFGGYGSGSDPDAVLAAKAGTVTYADWVSGNGAGRMVVIKHPDGWMTRYMHLAKIDVKQGQAVQQGQRVGTRGGSGFDKDNSYAVHLHFEIRDPGDQPRNPRDFLPKPQIPQAG